ncbi:MAG: ABC transporter permease [Actinobacteria bacterium]|nr:MAG: ABC transporter permease [Actinomycetota bacterium]
MRFASESGSILPLVAVDTAPTEPRTSVLPSFAWLTGYGELLRTLLRRELRARYQGSALGLVWSLLFPLAMMGVYTLVFSVLWRGARNIPHYPLFVLAGLAVWTFFQSSVALGTTSLVTGADLIKKVWFPRELVPAAVVLAQTISALVILGILVPFSLYVVPENARTVALVLPFFLALLCLALGLAWMLSVANVFFRDVEHLVAVLFLPWFFLTPVLYGLDQLPAAASHQTVIHLLRYGNPVTPYVEGIRAVVLEATVPGVAILVYIFLVGPLTALLGLAVLQRYEDRVAIEL